MLQSGTRQPQGAWRGSFLLDVCTCRNETVWEKHKANLCGAVSQRYITTHRNGQVMHAQATRKAAFGTTPQDADMLLAERQVYNATTIVQDV